MDSIPQLPLDGHVDAEATTSLAMHNDNTKLHIISAPPTPPITPEDPDGAQLLARAVHVLSTEATALSFVARMYQNEPGARAGLVRAVDVITRANAAGGKLVVCGVGKSGIVGMKLVATMKSFGLAASFMHGAEAIHGDLGDIRQNDAVLFITYSGRTQELLAAAQHIDDATPVIIMTAHLSRATLALCAARDDANTVLLPAPVHETEERSFGVSAPTTSTTVAMAVGDMLAIAAAERCCEPRGGVGAVFGRNHPGGAIGQKKRRLS